MNTFASKLGFDESKFVFTDVFSTDDWALEMVPKPVLAVLLLFPIKTESEAFRRQRNEKASKVVSDKVYFMKQTVDNACGTIGILHAIGNAVMEEVGRWHSTYFELSSLTIMPLTPWLFLLIFFFLF